MIYVAIDKVRFLTKLVFGMILKCGSNNAFALPFRSATKVGPYLPNALQVSALLRTKLA